MTECMKNRLERSYEASPDAADYAKGYANTVRAIFDELDYGAVAKVARWLRKIRDCDGTLFFAGNGGSAAVCSHLANDLGAMASEGAQSPFRAVSLTDNTPYITALANDSGFGNVFINQLLGLFRPGDLLVVMSGSGNSENLVRAVRHVNDNSGVSIGILGFDGGLLKPMCHEVLHIPTQHREYGPVEDVFMIVSHMVSTYLAFDVGLFGKPPTHPCHRVADESTVES